MDKFDKVEQFCGALYMCILIILGAFIIIGVIGGWLYIFGVD